MLTSLNRILKRSLTARSGYTIDQTILIVAIIAILITMIIATIGWQLINRTSGTKLASQLNQVEDSLAQFYGTHRSFPHTFFATGTITSAGIPLTLAGLTPTGMSNPVSTSPLVNLLPGLPVVGGAVTNGYNGAVTMLPGAPAGWVGGSTTQQSMIVQFANIPLSDAVEAERAIDPVTSATAGRLVYSASSCLPATTGGTVPTVGAVPAGTTIVNVCFVSASLN